MQSSNAPTKLKLPFASSGGKNTIPNTSQIGIVAGAASYPDGFPPLTRTPLVAGGVPPSGLDMNGVLFEMTAIARWLASGAGFTYDSAWASDSNVGGYPKGARVMRSDGVGYWLNTTDNNATDPEAGGAGWVPDYTHGVAAVTMTSSNVTLTALQYGKPIIVITGTLTANLNMIFPNLAGDWVVINNATGSFTITAKTAAGTGVVVSGSQGIVGDGTNIYSISGASTVVAPQIITVGASVSASALTATYGGGSLQFRNPTPTNGTPTSPVTVAPNSITVPSGATLGTVNAQSARLILIEAYNSGSPVMCICNLSGGLNLDETSLISPTTISSGSNSRNIIYSATAVGANSPFRVIGFVDITQATAGAWVTAPTLVQGTGGAADLSLTALGYGQTWQNVTGSRTLGVTYYNTTGKPIQVSASTYSSTAGAIASLTVDGVIACQTTQSSVGYNSVQIGIIPPGSSYSVNQAGSGPAIYNWSELR